MPCSSTPRWWMSIRRRSTRSTAAGHVSRAAAGGRIPRPCSPAQRGVYLHAGQRPRRSARGPQELDSLANVYRAAGGSNHGEDDIIMLGDLQSDPEHLGRLGRVPWLTAAINGVPTTTRGTQLGRQYPLRPPRDGRIHRPFRRIGHDPRIGSHPARGAGGFPAPARLGRVQLL